MSNAAASYLPDCQVITLKPHFAAFDDPDNLRGVVGASQVSYFFHEWLHYLHNVSTLHGLSAFANQVGLWGSFRFATGPDGHSSGSAALPEHIRLAIRQNLTFLSAARGPKKNDLPSVTDLARVRITNAVPDASMVEGAEAPLTVLVCTAEVPQSVGAPELVTLRIGAHEILESLAVMLEDDLVLRLGGQKTLALVAPYQLLRALGRWRAPELSEYQVCLCGLATLQSSDPAGDLMDILDFARVAATSGRDPELDVRKRAAEVLEASSSWVDQTLASIERAFPVDEPLARAVKQTTAALRRNLEERKRDPFFEFRIISELAQDVQRMDAVIKRHGGCCVIQQRPGDVNMLGRDLMYDFALGPPDTLLEFGWRMMHATFRFITLHSAQDGIVPTTLVRIGERTRCPFYTVCGYQLRTEAPDVCATEPWKSVAVGDQATPCWYSAAVRALRPPPRAA